MSKYLLLLLATSLFVACQGLDPYDLICLEAFALQGPCDGNFIKYSYNVERDACESFVYGGCGGNHNRYDTKAKCEYACQTYNKHLITLRGEGTD